MTSTPLSLYTLPMKSNRIEDLNAVKWHLFTAKMDLEFIIKEEADTNNGKVPRELAVAFLHLKESVKALNLFLKDAVPDDLNSSPRRDTFNTELNSGTDS